MLCSLLILELSDELFKLHLFESFSLVVWSLVLDQTLKTASDWLNGPELGPSLMCRWSSYFRMDTWQLKQLYKDSLLLSCHQRVDSQSEKWKDKGQHEQQSPAASQKFGKNSSSFSLSNVFVVVDLSPAVSWLTALQTSRKSQKKVKLLYRFKAPPLLLDRFSNRCFLSGVWKE